MMRRSINPAKFKVTTTDDTGKEIVIAEGYATSYAFQTRADPVYQLGSFSIVEYVPQPMQFELKGLIYPAEERHDDIKPMTGTIPDMSLDSDIDPEKLREADKWSEYDDDY